MTRLGKKPLTKLLNIQSMRVFLDHQKITALWRAMHSSGIGQPGSAECACAKVWPMLSATPGGGQLGSSSTGNRVCCCELRTLPEAGLTQKK